MAAAGARHARREHPNRAASRGPAPSLLFPMGAGAHPRSEIATVTFSHHPRRTVMAEVSSGPRPSPAFQAQ